MHVIKTIEEMRLFCGGCQKEGLSVGLVPTMGALHQGHISLVKKAVIENQVAVVSIFVNPIQFNNTTDLTHYPRTLDADLALLGKAGCKVVFAPSEEEMYADKPMLSIHFGLLEQVMEGAFRPGHFSGVGVVVAKLFAIIQPTNAYFGQKDLQQFLVIQQLVKDLSFPVTLHRCAIVREEDGLAMSSRNTRLTKKNRPLAAKIFESLQLAERLLPEKGIDFTKEEVRAFLAQQKELTLEYFEIADGNTLVSQIEYKVGKITALCIVVYLDGVRLIDNVLLE
jgi:pantoate--beta-alanine ligase